MKMSIRFTSFLAAAVVASGFAFAGSGEHGARHGGVAREAKGITYELVARSDALTVYVMDHGKPVSTQGAQGKATVHAGSEKTEVALEPAANGTLAAKGAFKTGLGTRVAVAVKLQGRDEQRLTFNLK